MTTQRLGSDNRHYGIDALRTLCMFMVVTVHVLGNGGLLLAAKPPSFRYLTVWTLESASYCLVNCYAMISGYMGVKGRYRYTSLVMLWLQVVLWNVVCTVAQAILQPGSVTVPTLIRAFYPVANEQYWYFCVYTGLFLLMPGLNIFLNKINRRQGKALCLLIILVFTCIPALANKDSFGMREGYSIGWVLLMYLLGGCLSRFRFGHKLPTWLLLLLYVGSVALSVAATTLADLSQSENFLRLLSHKTLMGFNTPTSLVCGLCLMLIFQKYPQPPSWLRKIIRLLAPVSFGVYIIHMHPFMQDVFFGNMRYRFLIQYSAPVLAAAVILTCVVIFLVCAGLDWLRLWLFKGLKLKQRLQKLEDKYIGNLWNSENES